MRSEGADLEIRYFQETIEPEAAERMVLRMPEGAITISCSPDAFIHADYELHGSASLLPVWRSSVRRHDSILIVTNETPKEIYTASVTVRIPERIKDLEVHSMKGEIDVRECPIDLLVISELGTIHIHGAHNVEASSIQGAITLLNCGSATVNTIDGSVKCTKLSGSLHVETQGGDIQASRIKGNVIALSASGDISVLKPEGRIRLISHGGDIELELAGVFGGGRRTPIPATSISCSSRPMSNSAPKPSQAKSALRERQFHPGPVRGAAPTRSGWVRNGFMLKACSGTLKSSEAKAPL